MHLRSMKFSLRGPLTIGRQIGAGFAVLVVLLALEGSAAQWGLTQDAHLRQQYALSVAQTRSVGQIEAAVAGLRLDAENYFAYRLPAQWDHYQAGQKLLTQL